MPCACPGAFLYSGHQHSCKWFSYECGRPIFSGKAEEVFGYVGSYQEIWLGVSMVSVLFYAAKSLGKLTCGPDDIYRPDDILAGEVDVDGHSDDRKRGVPKVSVAGSS
ncbi:hypothetical protein HPB50_006730 [Hyalomma asiaticum]|uniref:Uncharacterized protein n=1 Tax=Hyalomma asiaticum TaxID=266040 RepID=A0ACB7TJH7_HYAAI|nr:hypothetical protein HPB50_006730 [Hyalomma asiaticum]